MRPMIGARISRAARWAIVSALVVVLGVVGAPFVYIHFIESDPPPPFHLSSSPTTVAGSAPASGSRAPLVGTWKIASGSQAGYRVNEVLFGQNNKAAGRTSGVTGSLAIAGTTVRTADFTVDLTTVASDESRRDNQFQGRIMNTADFPTAKFTLKQPIALGTAPVDGKVVSTTATGDLTLHGTTRSVTVSLQAHRTGNTLEIAGSIPVTFADFQIPNPSFATITTEDHGEVEFLLELTPA